ncbi:MAG: hypothetical protein H8E60_09340 [Candidatus Marinimicrobia bacterium]|nr:hypothetical protein [Candidatus Neomarinimicrobiota bacterium]
MFSQRNFIYLSLIYISFFGSIIHCQINEPKKPDEPIRVKSMDDDQIHELHQYLIKNKSLFINHEILMVHPEYYIYLREILNQIDKIIKYNKKQPIIDKKVLSQIGLEFEEMHFIDFIQLESQIKNKLIRNKIEAIEK